MRRCRRARSRSAARRSRQPSSPPSARTCTRCNPARCARASPSRRNCGWRCRGDWWCGWRCGSAGCTRARWRCCAASRRAPPPASPPAWPATRRSRTPSPSPAPPRPRAASHAPPRAAVLRAVMAEIERLAGHLADLAATGQAAGFARLAALCLPQREALLRAAAAAFGHRLMMDCVVPGGVAAEIAPGGTAAIVAALAGLEAALPALARLHDGSGSLLRRLVGVGRVAPARCARSPPAGWSGAPPGARSTCAAIPATRPMTASTWPCRCGTERRRGGAAAAAARRDAERHRAAARPCSPPRSGRDRPAAAAGLRRGHRLCRGPSRRRLALAAAGRRQIAACFPRDPAWLHWPLVEAAMAGGASPTSTSSTASFVTTVARGWICDAHSPRAHRA